MVVGSLIRRRLFPGSPFDGPFGSENISSQMDDVSKVLEMDHQLDVVRHRLNDLATVRPGKAGVNAPILQSLILLNCLFVNLHHLRVALGLSSLPFNPTAPIVPGSPEYSMQRCLEGIHSTYEARWPQHVELHNTYPLPSQIVAQLATYENMRTSPYLSRVTTFTTFLPCESRTRSTKEMSADLLSLKTSCTGNYT